MKELALATGGCCALYAPAEKINPESARMAANCLFMVCLLDGFVIDPCFLTLCDSLPQSHIQNVLYLEKKGKPLFNYPFKRVNIRIYVSKCNLSLEEESKNKRQTSATSSRRP